MWNREALTLLQMASTVGASQLGPLSGEGCVGRVLQPGHVSSGRSGGAESERKLQEILQAGNVLTIGGQRHRVKTEDLEQLGDLGCGTCGHVVKMRHRPTGKVLAVKQMRRSGNREENKRITMDLEVVLRCQDCPHIVQCLGYLMTEGEVWICMELMCTCLDKLLRRLRPRALPEDILGRTALGVLRALHYLKERHGLIHRDVKPSNVLLDRAGRVRLCDFGISGRLVDSKARTRSAGCAAYMAPERIDPPDPTKPDYDIRADVWSLGISMVELATGQFPYKDCKTDFEVLSRVLQEKPPSLPNDGSFSPEFCSFVKDCLTKDYRERPKYRELLEHPFIKRYETKEVDVAAWLAEVMDGSSEDGL
ncbi:mitogen-activated protein kinase kinase MKK4, putative [Ixodes scapularis]|uniref:Dual specificity mitogen-activated protein kinase kinase 7 n=1 Tax=Ixodes scapularis TaxID=6945 RepID=B7PVJ6_IXOSC|nr:mitogen-activated protein kinase kinase MKK4, putative [Ixodes scapularis]|eukprot:XP_002408117.1 mitogen-activated protein kinase kinase MKK4, putative [Ixodes scapularis]